VIITQIEPITKAKSKIFTDEQISFVLYNKEISGYSLAEGCELTEGTYREILNGILMKRAKLRAMHLLQKMDRTEQQLRQKLNEGGYPDEVVESAVAYVRKFHYVDDRRYAQNYVDTRKGVKSRRQIQQELRQKGIAADTTQAVLEEYEQEQEREAILAWMRKKKYSAEQASLEERRKMYNFLLRKGFHMGEILSCLHVDAEYMQQGLGRDYI